MKQYKYKARNLQQEEFNGVFIAEDEFDLAKELQKQGLYLISCKEYDGTVKPSFFSLSGSKVKMTEINSFCRQFAIMINAGMSILGCLDVLKNQKYSALFSAVLGVLDDDVRAGMMFSEAINKHKKIFPQFFRSMIAVGEKSGQLDTVLESLADYYEKDAAAKRKIKGALAYPIMLSIMTVAIVVLMLGYVVPTFRESLSALEVEATGITKVIWDLSDFILEQGLSVLAIIFAVIAVVFLFSRTKSGKMTFGKLKVTFPGIKNYNTAIITSRFASAFGLLLKSGMDAVDALDAAIIVFDNKYVEKQYINACQEIRHGVNMSVAFENAKIFPVILTQMVAIGEKTNALDEVLNRSCSYFNERVDEAITKLTSRLQPAILLIMGLVVGTMFVGLYAPMLDIMQQL